MYVSVMIALPPTRAKTESKVGIVMAMNSRAAIEIVLKTTLLHVKSANLK